MSKQIVERLIRGGGWLPEEPAHDAPDNPRAARIVRYVDQRGKRAYGVTFAHERDPFRYERESDYISEPVVIWTAEDGVLE